MALFDRTRNNIAAMANTPDPSINQGVSAVKRSTPRPLIASGQRLKLSKEKDRDMIRNRVYTEWQEESWAYFDSIGEIKYGFLMLASVMSRIRLFAGIDIDKDSAPTSIASHQDRQSTATDDEKSDDIDKGLKLPSYITQDVLDYCDKLVSDLTNDTGSHSEFLRRYSMNMSVAGECYLIDNDGEWQIRSSSEIFASVDGKVYIRSVRTANAYGAGSSNPNMTDDELPKDAYVGRIWKSHARYMNEPDSSMLSIRESCDELLVLQRMIRTVARSRMNSGILFLPDGLTVAGSTLAEDIATDQEQQDELLTDIYDSLTDPIDDETAPSSVVPMILTGEGSLGNEIKHIPLGRETDQWLVDRTDRALERIMQGLDMPKDIVSGLAHVKYSNAQNIDASLYKAHIEPSILMLCDTLNQIYFKPALEAKFPHLKDKDLTSLCIWYDPSEVVTNVDPTQTASEGYDKQIISESAWRRTHGFSDTDAPTEEEMARRYLLNKGAPGPEQLGPLFSAVFPNLMSDAKEQAVKNSNMPESAQQLLYPNGFGAPGAAAPEPAPAEGAEGAEGAENEQNQGTPPPNGQRPPRSA